MESDYQPSYKDIPFKNYNPDMAKSMLRLKLGELEERLKKLDKAQVITAELWRSFITI